MFRQAKDGTNEKTFETYRIKTSSHFNGTNRFVLLLLFKTMIFTRCQQIYAVFLYSELEFIYHTIRYDQTNDRVYRFICQNRNENDRQRNGRGTTVNIGSFVYSSRQYLTVGIIFYSLRPHSIAPAIIAVALCDFGALLEYF